MLKQLVLELQALMVEQVDLLRKKIKQIKNQMIKMTSLTPFQASTTLSPALISR